jgi:hypothetical protein
LQAGTSPNNPKTDDMTGGSDQLVASPPSTANKIVLVRGLSKECDLSILGGVSQ